MVELAVVPEGQKMQLQTLAEATGVRATFLSKILQRLVHRGLVLSHRGTGGGFCLKVLPDSVTLLQVIEAMEGPLQLNVCMGEGTGCDRKASCATHPYWLDAQVALKTVLGAVTIAQLAEESSHLDVQELRN